MAIYHFSAQVISRSQGRSSVAAAAYRAAASFLDERTGLLHDFTNKNDVLESDILLPDSAPSWMKDRERLWNAVEAVEKRVDAQLAREINISLPRELNAEQNWVLAREFVQREFVDLGMVADLNFHRGHMGQEEQPHVHVMLSLREVGLEGFGQKVRAWNDKALLHSWRERWAEYCNLALATQGFDMRIDHRTLEAQGIDLEPQSKIGSKVASQRMARFEEHQALAKRNGERLFKDPRIALDALTHQQSTFTHHDLARFVNRHSVSAEQFQLIYEKLKAHADLVYLGQDDQQRDRYTTKGMLDIEAGMIEAVLHQVGMSTHSVAEHCVRSAIAGKALSEEQIAALNHITGKESLASIVGYAGTGKSYLLGAAREAWEKAGYQVQGLTLSGIAAESLEAGSGIASRTVASKLWHWERDREPLSSKDILVIDEAGMLGSRQLAKIIEAANQAHAKLVLVGDPEQLQAIEAGAAFRAIIERTGFAEMTEIRRQKVQWQKEATQCFASQKTKEGLLAYEKHHYVHAFSTEEQAIQTMVEHWDEVRSQEPQHSQIMLAYTRDEVRFLNEKARALHHAQKELGQDHEIETARGKRVFAEKDRVYFLRNENQELKVKNGTLGTIEKIEQEFITIRLDQTTHHPPRSVIVNLETYNDLDHGYAATVYKAQGITVDRTYILASKYFDRHSTYVAMSRHRESADIYYSQEHYPDFGKFVTQMSRERLKDISLDYGKTRGFDLDQKDSSASSIEKFALSPEVKRIIEIEEKLTQLRIKACDQFAHEYIELLEQKQHLRSGYKLEQINKTLDKKSREIFKDPEMQKMLAERYPKLIKSVKARVQASLEQAHVITL